MQAQQKARYEQQWGKRCIYRTEQEPDNPQCWGCLSESDPQKAHLWDQFGHLLGAHELREHAHEVLISNLGAI